MKKSLQGMKKPRLEKTAQLLIESNQPPSNIVALSIFVPIYCIEKNTSAVVFSISKSSSLLNRIKSILHSFSIEYNFGCFNSILISDSKIANKDFFTEEIFTLINEKNPTKLENLYLNSILIGDLIYDTYLSRTGNPTVNFEDPVLISIIKEAFNLVNNWEKYFQDNTVKAICVSHCVYLKAIPLRVALKFGIEVFQVNTDAIYRISLKFPFSYTDFREYPVKFRELELKTQLKGRDQAQSRLQLRFSGVAGVDMPYSNASAFIKPVTRIESPIKPSKNIKVLIAMHDFFDSPHGYGMNFYPDFYIWLTKLNELSKQVNYDWYIKTHIDVQGNGREVLKNFVKDSNNFVLLPPDTTHFEILEGGIDVALTVFGTIAMEYPALGKLVINASQNNPHSAYNFSITPKSKEEYENLILNLKEVLLEKRFEGNIQEEIFEYYFMHNLYEPNSWIYINYDQYLSEVGGYKASVSLKAYKYFIKTKNKFNSEYFEKGIIKFLNSDELRLSRRHFENTKQDQ